MDSGYWVWDLVQRGASWGRGGEGRGVVAVAVNNPGRRVCVTRT